MALVKNVEVYNAGGIIDAIYQKKNTSDSAVFEIYKDSALVNFTVDGDTLHFKDPFQEEATMVKFNVDDEDLFETSIIVQEYSKVFHVTLVSDSYSEDTLIYER